MDIHISVDGNQTLKEAHDLTRAIEHAIEQVVPNADVTVHPEPNPEERAKSPKDRVEEFPPKVSIVTR